MSGDYGFCERCSHYGHLPCRCVAFHGCVPFRGEAGDWLEVYEKDAEAAAERFCDAYDSDGDYTIIKSGSADVWVRDAAGVITKWFVEAEAVPTYSAHAAKELPATQGP